MLLLINLACNRSTFNHEKSKTYNKNAMKFYFSGKSNTDSLRKANLLLDSALLLDSSDTYVINKIGVLIKLNERTQALNWCDWLIRNKKLNFLPYLYKANIYSKLQNEKSANLNYDLAVKNITSKNKFECKDFIFLINIFLIKKDPKRVQYYLKKHKKLNCLPQEGLQSYINSFNASDYLKEF